MVMVFVKPLQFLKFPLMLLSKGAFRFDVFYNSTLVLLLSLCFITEESSLSFQVLALISVCLLIIEQSAAQVLEPIWDHNPETTMTVLHLLSLV